MMTFFLRYRKSIRRIIGFSIILVLALANSFPNIILKHTGVYSGIVVAIIYVLTEFGQEVFGFFQNKLDETAREKNIKRAQQLFVGFLTKYFGLQVFIPEFANKNIPLIINLDDILENIPDASLGNKPEHKRRLKMIPLIFLLKYQEIPDLLCGEDVFVITKIRYRDDLTETGQNEFLSIYYNLVINDKNLSKIPDYFSTLKKKEYENSRLHFLDNYMKDDYVNFVVEKLNFSEKQAERFKDSMKSIAQSSRFNIKYLKEYILQKQRYRKFFLIVSPSGMPKKIQNYIKQNPYFILRRTTIYNLPGIGSSQWVDIFLFSPLRIISSANDLLTELKKIDSRIVTYPLKIYEIDPFESLGVSLGNNLDFYHSVQFFESLVFDPTQVKDFNYNQFLSVLEYGQVSIKEIVCELPVSEFLSSLTENDKRLIDKIHDPFIVKGKNRDVFSLIGREKQIVKSIQKMTQEELVGEEEVPSMFPSCKTISDVRKHLVSITNELHENIHSLSSSLV